MFFGSSLTNPPALMGTGCRCKLQAMRERCHFEARNVIVHNSPVCWLQAMVERGKSSNAAEVPNYITETTRRPDMVM